MTTLAKQKVRNLTPEQQEALGGMELQHIRARQQLLERARRGMSVGAGLWAGLACGLAIFSTVFPRALPFAIIAVVGLVTLHASRLYRRLDAVMELVDEHTKREQDDDENAT